MIIDGRFSIDVDTMGNHMLVEDNGKGRKKIHGYHSNVAQALKKYLDITTPYESEVKVIGDYIKRYERAVDKLLEGFKGV